MSNSTHNLNLLVYDPTWTFNNRATLSLTVAADGSSVSGIFGYIGPPKNLNGTLKPANDGSQDNYELIGDGVSMRISSYQVFGGQYPVAGVATIDEAGPFFVIGKQSSS